ncbi:M28 family peptidase [Prevotella sp. PINT]|uniref:M28 family peptidase n=1 Tax=Palleniella intestinalis TaxID=2736291 RepID=UPI0015582811|nr:M28 family peptidase [Palleniella intestinalis]
MRIILLFSILLAMASCKSSGTSQTTEEPIATGPEFCADSAYIYCKQQCDFGPRTMNTDAHDRCRDWIAKEFQRHGCTVELQQADLKAYDGTMLRSTNIIARRTSSDSTATERPRILLCAHYDTRPWADNDPNPENHHTPVIGANDGASGIAVMLEVARLLNAADSANVDVDFVCFDAEDYGTPQWYKGESQVDDPWALGAQHWAKEYAKNPSGNISFGILLDMVGGEGAKFHQEGMSLQFAQQLVQKVWSAASTAGYGTHFPSSAGGYVTDDHVPVNEVAAIPCIDIIPYYPDCKESSFGPTWHTVNDTMDHISKETLKAVGQTVIQVIYSE